MPTDVVFVLVLCAVFLACVTVIAVGVKLGHCKRIPHTESGDSTCIPVNEEE
uniref:Uncharacterized protein n=2 Tax=viral metagenome TaxID=1070528 RepID=A0A6M3IG89_9ZZZZ